MCVDVKRGRWHNVSRCAPLGYLSSTEDETKVGNISYRLLRYKLYIGLPLPFPAGPTPPRIYSQNKTAKMKEHFPNPTPV